MDSEITRINSMLTQLQHRYETVKIKAERLKKLERALEELVGEKITTLNEIDFMGLKVIVSARTLDELKVLEETILSLQDMLNAMRRVKEIVSKLSEALTEGGEGMSIMVQTMNNIPIRILLKEVE